MTKLANNFLFFIENHWNGLLINVKNRSISIIDPFGIEEERFEKYFKSWCGYYNSRKDCLDLTWSKKSVTHQLQTDSYNCGPWCCFFLKELVLRGSIVFSSSFLIDNFRLEMCNDISKFI